MKQAITHASVLLSCIFFRSIHGHGATERQLGAAGTEQRPLPTCAEPCITELVRNGSCSGSRDWDCLCGHGLVSNDMRSRFEQHCMPSVRDYLIAQNLTATDCGVAQREQPPLVQITSMILGVLALACIVLRLCEKSDRRDKWRNRQDDWIMILNGVFLVAFTAVGIELPRHGMGKDSYTLPFPTLEIALKLLITHEALYVTIVTVTKLSVLFVYLRILPLSIMPKLRVAIPLAMVFVTAAGIGQVTAVIFQCVPVTYFWGRITDSRGGHCLNINAWGWANGFLNVAMETCLICLPLPEVVRLTLSWKEKLRACLMFMVGGISILVTIPRLVLMRNFVRSTDDTWKLAPITFVSALEAYICVIGACLPRIWILFSRLYRKYRSQSDATGNSRSVYPMVATLPSVYSHDACDPENCLGMTYHDPVPHTCVCGAETRKGRRMGHRGARSRMSWDATSSDSSHIGDMQYWTLESICARPASI